MCIPVGNVSIGGMRAEGGGGGGGW
eukprot:SAG31_NODE_744_length_12415_cov_74.120900_10_plen_25_part_01